jgi:hypothetical protein
MTDIITLDITEQTVSAFGHPTNCTEPAPGSVSQYQDVSNNVTITNTNSETSRVASRADANLSIPSHAHSYSILEGCYQNESHKILPDKDKDSASVTVNGSPVFLSGDSVTTDPTSGGDVSLSTEVNNSITYSPA